MEISLKSDNGPIQAGYRQGQAETERAIWPGLDRDTSRSRAPQSQACRRKGKIFFIGPRGSVMLDWREPWGWIPYTFVPRCLWRQLVSLRPVGFSDNELYRLSAPGALFACRCDWIQFDFNYKWSFSIKDLEWFFQELRLVVIWTWNLQMDNFISYGFMYNATL